MFVKEPTAGETIAMLRGLRATYQSFHEVSISNAALEEAVRQSVRHIPDRRLPDKAIDLIDEAASQRRAGLAAPPSGDAEATDTSLIGDPGSHRAVGPEDVRRVIEELVGRDGDDAWAAKVYGRGRSSLVRRLISRRRGR